MITYLYKMDILQIYLKLHIVVMCIGHAICWLDVVRSYSLNSNNNKKQKRPQRSYNSKIHGCRKDRHCEAAQFCNRYERVCMSCKIEGAMCRRNKMCCRGMECAAGKCRKKIQLGLENSLCKKDRDCNYGLCCAREQGQSICKPMLKEGDLCGIPQGGTQYFWSHQCPCQFGLKCKEVTNKTIKSKKLQLKLLMNNWEDGKNRRCVKARIKQNNT